MGEVERIEHRSGRAEATAVLLVGYQNDYFAADGRLRGFIEDDGAVARVLDATLDLIARLVDTETTLISTPVFFTAGYEELVEPAGILAAIRDLGAFQPGSSGARVVDELERFGGRIICVPGTRGLGPFTNPDLDAVLKHRGIREVVLAGALSCVGVDPAGRSARERGYRVTVLSDCMLGRTAFELDLFCTRIFPLYAEVVDSVAFLDGLGQRGLIGHDAG